MAIGRVINRVSFVILFDFTLLLFFFFAPSSGSAGGGAQITPWLSPAHLRRRRPILTAKSSLDFAGSTGWHRFFTGD